MTKFCSECGNSLPNENVKFCPECGNKILSINNKIAVPSTLEVQNEKNPSSIQKEEKSNNLISSIIFILIGGFAIFSIYVFPIVNVIGKPLTIADIHNYCSNSFIRIIGGSVCSEYESYFYVLWAIGIFLIIFGMINIVRRH
jgi:hypothetical protein